MVLFSIIMTLVSTIANIILLREVLYSIFVGDFSNSRSRRKKADKIHREQTPLDRILMSYIPLYLKRFAKIFRIYSKIYYIYIIVSMLAFVYFTIVLFNQLNSLFIISWCVFSLINLFFFVLIYIIAGVGSDRRTKYDRQAMK